MLFSSNFTTHTKNQPATLHSQTNQTHTTLKKSLNLYASQIFTLVYVINQSIVRRGKNNSHLKKHFYNVE